MEGYPEKNLYKSESEISESDGDHLLEELEEEGQEEEEEEGDFSGEANQFGSDRQFNDVPLGIRVKIMEERAKNKFQKQFKNQSQKIVVETNKNKQEQEQTSQHKRLNKNRPMEVSSKVKPSKFRDVPGLSGKFQKTWDPRFDQTAGNFSDETFRRRFGFVFDQVLPNEIKNLQKQIKQESEPDKKWELKQQLVLKKQKLKQHKDKIDKDNFEKELKDQQKESIKAGNKPYYLNRRQRQELMLKRKFDKLKEEGRLEKVIAKKKKKRAIKDQKILEKQNQKSFS